MIAEIRKHLEQVPFVPFAIRVADGRECRVPTIDHIYLPPAGRNIIVSDDDGVTVAIPSILISGLVRGAATTESTPKP